MLSSTKLSFFRDSEAQQFNTALHKRRHIFIQHQLRFVVLHGQTVQLPGFFDFNIATGGLPLVAPRTPCNSMKTFPGRVAGTIMKFGGQFNYIQLDRGYGAYEQAIEALGKKQCRQRIRRPGEWHGV